MKRLILGGAFAMLLVPSVVMATPATTHVDLRNAVIDPGDHHPDFTCSTGGATSLLVGAAALGLLLRRRR
jgi:MYXO-CTERM domain-containing protein